jgi:hypothetical protein
LKSQTRLRPSRRGELVEAQLAEGILAGKIGPADRSAMQADGHDISLSDLTPRSCCWGPEIVLRNALAVHSHPGLQSLHTSSGP